MNALRKVIAESDDEEEAVKKKRMKLFSLTASSGGRTDIALPTGTCGGSWND